MVIHAADAFHFGKDLCYSVDGELIGAEASMDTVWIEGSVCICHISDPDVYDIQFLGHNPAFIRK
jgi:hypothetical protein